MKNPTGNVSNSRLERVKEQLTELQKEFGNKDKTIPPPTEEELEQMFKQDYRKFHLIFSGEGKGK
jgi:hypothetical protein